MLEKYHVNELLSLELRNDSTYVYVNNREVSICQHIAVNMSIEQIEFIDEINSVDELSELYGRTERAGNLYIITPEEEFFVHCSNFQAWAEQGYNTKLLHSNISFPLLKRLVEAGDLIAKRVFKEEIVKRYISGSEKVQSYLSTEGYLDLLTNIERELIFKEKKKLEKLKNNLNEIKF